METNNRIMFCRICGKGHVEKYRSKTRNSLGKHYTVHLSWVNKGHAGIQGNKEEDR